MSSCSQKSHVLMIGCMAHVSLRQCSKRMCSNSERNCAKVGVNITRAYCHERGTTTRIRAKRLLHCAVGMDGNITCDQGALAGEIGEATNNRTDLLARLDVLHHPDVCIGKQRKRR